MTLFPFISSLTLEANVIAGVHNKGDTDHDVPEGRNAEGSVWRFLNRTQRARGERGGREGQSRENTSGKSVRRRVEEGG